jgi:hypothetical protein
MNLNRKLKFTNNNKVFSVILILAALILFVPQAAHADWVTTVVGGIAQGLASVLGWILAKVMAVLVYIAQYNNFIKSAAIVNGWVIARDISNMFFVVILLVIAFATILRLENYSYKKWLPKLILMAILINFSKTICGLLIDLAQVVMLTFVNAFKDVAAGGLVDMLGIKDWQSLKGIENVSDWEVAGAYVLSVIYSAIALITITAMVGMLVMRIIMIWVYVVLSPFAYLLAAFPGGAQYSSMWWKDFTKNLIVGPVLAFFIWLSFTSLVSFNNSSLGIDGTVNDQTQALTCQTNEQGVCDLGTTDIMIKFIISIAMLLGGMKIAQEIGGAAAGVAGKISSAGNKLAIGAAAGVGLAAWKYGKGKAGDLRDNASLAMGVDLNVADAWKRRNVQQEHDRQHKKNKIREVTLSNATDDDVSGFKRNMALLSTGDVAYRNLKEWRFGGSKSKRDSFRSKMDDEKGKQDVINSDISGLEKEKGKFITEAEEIKGQNQISSIHKEIEDKKAEVDIISTDKVFQDLEKKEKGGYINSKEQTDLDSRRGQIKSRESEIDNLSKKQEQIREKISVGDEYVVANDTEKADKISAIDSQIASKQAEKQDSVKIYQDSATAINKNRAKYTSSALAEVQSNLEREAEKGISGKTNSAELANIFKEAMDDHDSGLMTAVAKKMAKLGNYNDLLGSLNLGTGLDGMHGLADKMKNEGGMSEQASLGVIAELGEITKAGKHYQGFGTVSMDDTGNWQKNNYAQQQAAIFGEQSKVQVQSFSRDANRLGIGHYEGGEHTAKNWVLDDATIALFASKDASYAKQIEDTGNVNLISFIAANEKNLELLEKNGAVQVAKNIRDLAKKVQGGNASNPLEAIKGVIH